jgi:pilus assembly protein Flp/PilA
MKTIRRMLKALRRSTAGQGMTEYIIIVAVIAIGAIAVITVFGDNIRALFGTSANALTGPTGATITTTPVTEGQQNRNLSTFGADQAP